MNKISGESVPVSFATPTYDCHFTRCLSMLHLKFFLTKQVETHSKHTLEA